MELEAITGNHSPEKVSTKAWPQENEPRQYGRTRTLPAL